MVTASERLSEHDHIIRTFVTNMITSSERLSRTWSQHQNVCQNMITSSLHLAAHDHIARIFVTPHPSESHPISLAHDHIAHIISALVSTWGGHDHDPIISSFVSTEEFVSTSSVRLSVHYHIIVTHVGKVFQTLFRLTNYGGGIVLASNLDFCQ